MGKKKFEGSKSIYEFSAYKQAWAWKLEVDRLKARILELEQENERLRVNAHSL
jgi:hypothetical protein